MGTRGHKVYRHKGRYFVYYNHWDSYPSGFGLKVLHGIPRGVSKEEFEEWVRRTREDLDAQYEELNDPNIETKGYVTDEQPENDTFIEWTYEIDLDNLIFHVDSQPLFRLDNMPPDNVFLITISFDHFGHRAYYEDTPVQYRYDWRAPPPPPPPTSLTAYNSCPNRSSSSSVHDLLHMPMKLSPIERARTALVGLLVTRCMTSNGVGHCVRILESVPDRDHIPQGMLELALSLVNFAVGPPIPSLPCTSHGNNWDFIWIREDVCLRITTNLDDEDNLQASIGDLVHHINTTQDKLGTVYGVACSVFHCSVVRLDKDKDGQVTSFTHTPALQFLPSFYARKISTPGIEALSRLGCQTSGVECLGAISEAYNLPRITHKESLAAKSVTAKVPVEVWANVGHYISSPIDLIKLASISPRAMSAAADLARYPMAMDFRLVDVVGPIASIPKTTGRTGELEREDQETRRYYKELGRAKFTAVKGDRRVTVELGQEYHKSFAGRRELSFQVQTYLTGPVALREDELYVLELDDEKAS